MKFLPSTATQWVVVLLFSAAFTPALGAELPRYHLTAKDGRFIPETVEVPAGKKFRLVVRNEGAVPEEFESHELNREKVVPAGRTVDVIIGPLEAGSYSFFGDFHPTTAKGRIIAK